MIRDPELAAPSFARFEGSRIRLNLLFIIAISLSSCAYPFH
jgi:hypothetical protein